MNSLSGQTTMKDFFATVEEYNDVEYHYLRLHAEAMHMYKVKYFGECTLLLRLLLHIQCTMVFESTGRIRPDTLNTLCTIAGIQKDEKDVMRNHPRFTG